MDVLVTCLNYPYPLENGENLRIFQYVRALHGRHTFDLLCRGEPDVPTPLLKLFRHVYPIHPAHEVVPAGLLQRAFASFSAGQLCPKIPDLTDELSRLLSSNRYDLLWASADVLPRLPAKVDVPILGDIVDDPVLQYRRLLSSLEPGARYLRVAKRLVLTRRFVRRYFARAAACLYVSEADAQSFAALCPNKPVHVIHNGVDEDFFRAQDVAIEPESIVFEGNMSFFPNVDAAEYLCSSILPLIHQVRPGVKLYLVGKNPAARVCALASERVEVTGFVDDVRPYLSKATVFVSPTRVGAGIKNKILQAWSMGRPVVATPASTGGLRVRDRENIIVAESPQRFAGAVLELLGDSDLREKLGVEGRRTVIEHYTWDAKARELEALMQELTTGKS